MSTFRGWPEQQTYHGIEGGGSSSRSGSEPRRKWELELNELLDRGYRVVAIMRQHGRAKATGLPVE